MGEKNGLIRHRRAFIRNSVYTVKQAKECNEKRFEDIGVFLKADRTKLMRIFKDTNPVESTVDAQREAEAAANDGGDDDDDDGGSKKSKKKDKKKKDKDKKSKKDKKKKKKGGSDDEDDGGSDEDKRARKRRKRRRKDL